MKLFKLYVNFDQAEQEGGGYLCVHVLCAFIKAINFWSGLQLGRIFLGDSDMSESHLQELLGCSGTSMPLQVRDRERSPGIAG